jgi:hypothetical protein
MRVTDRRLHCADKTFWGPTMKRCAVVALLVAACGSEQSPASDPSSAGVRAGATAQGNAGAAIGGRADHGPAGVAGAGATGGDPTDHGPAGAAGVAGTLPAGGGGPRTTVPQEPQESQAIPGRQEERQAAEPGEKTPLVTSRWSSSPSHRSSATTTARLR